MDERRIRRALARVLHDESERVYQCALRSPGPAPLFGLRVAWSDALIRLADRIEV